MPQCIVELRSVSKRYGGHTALEDFSLEVWRGEFLTLLGPSGSGKTTILRLVAGFEQPQSGQILINGRDASPLPPYRRNVNTVFQHYALFPHLNVFRNVAFGLEQKKLAWAEIRQRIRSILEMVWCILPTARACRLRCQTATPEKKKAFPHHILCLPNREISCNQIRHISISCSVRQRANKVTKKVWRVHPEIKQLWHVLGHKSSSRRGFLTAAFAMGSALALRKVAAAAPTGAGIPRGISKPQLVTLVEFTDSGKREGTVMVEKVVKTDEEWKQVLTPEEFEVTRKKGTERAFTGKYWNNHEKGIYRCVCCGNALFSSNTKYESGTGWPSFRAPIAPENIRTESDLTLGMVRSEVLCKKCDAHLGHVFDDGPPPTHLRYCLNSAALKFVKG